tara:strand:- start:112 stop:354 length:243 start_codon:yes stop_codon:yes gene_type:complete
LTFLNFKLNNNTKEREINNMKILKVLEDAELIIVDLEVNLGDEVRSAPTLCARYKGKIIPLNTAHDGRPILMKEENSIEP